ncbi:MAG: sulfur carrier protein ThiS [Ignavibacteriaceae bacterium]
MIYINDEEYPFAEEESLETILLQLNIYASTGTAVAINNVVIPKIEWNNYLINDNDEIIIIKATQGG